MSSYVKQRIKHFFILERHNGEILLKKLSVKKKADKFFFRESLEQSC